jgi:hypothetical protein
MAAKVWKLMYVVGNTNRVISDAENPQTRKSALGGAAVIENNGWRVWVEHHETGKRIHEGEQEAAHRKAAEAKRIIEFARANVPGYRCSRLY